MKKKVKSRNKNISNFNASSTFFEKQMLKIYGCSYSTLNNIKRDFGLAFRNQRKLSYLGMDKGIKGSSSKFLKDELLWGNRRLSDKLFRRVKLFIKKQCVLGYNFRSLLFLLKKSRLEEKSWLVLRKEYKLPVRGQRTRTNASTQKKRA